MPHPEMDNLPTPSDYEDAVLKVQMRSMDSGIDIERAIRELANEFTNGMAPHYEKRARLIAASYIDPIDRTLGYDQLRGIPDIYGKGAMAGIAVQGFAHSNTIPHEMLVPVAKRDAEMLAQAKDPRHTLHLTGEKVVEMSQSGLDLMSDPAIDVLERWSETMLQPEQLRDQRTFLLGCGLVAYRAHIYAEKLDGARKRMPLPTEPLSGSFDWDSALRNLMDSDTGQ